MTVPMVSAAEFYSRLAPTYRDDFEVPHRKAYDQLCVEAVRSHLRTGSVVVDVGCGVGRWAEWLLADDHTVIGIEPSPGMAAECRDRRLGPEFTLFETDADDAPIEAGSADVVVAMGSIQYSPDPAASMARMASWLKPGGRLWVLVDALGILVHELVRRGDHAQALERATTGWACFSDGEVSVRHRVMTAAEVHRAFVGAGLDDIEVQGLLIGWSALPREQAQAALLADWDREIARERELSKVTELADLGKQLLATGIRPDR